MFGINEMCEVWIILKIVVFFYIVGVGLYKGRILGYVYINEFWVFSVFLD